MDRIDYWTLEEIADFARQSVEQVEAWANSLAVGDRRGVVYGRNGRPRAVHDSHVVEHYFAVRDACV